MNKLLKISLKYKRQIWSITLLLILQITSAQLVTIDWIAEIGGSSFVNANSLYVDNSGNAYVTGFFMGEVSIGNNTFVARGDSDIFLAKYDQNGDIKWFKQAGSNQASPNIASESGKSIAVDKAGNVYVCGIFVSRALFCDTTVVAHGSQDIFLAKYCNNGKLQWVKSMGHNGSNIAQELMIVSDVVYMTGKSSGSFFNEHLKNPLAFLAAFDPDGDLLWHRERETSLMVLNTFLNTGNNNIIWGATILETPLETAEPENTMPAFVFIEKMAPGGTVKTSGTFKIDPSSTEYTSEFMNGSTFLIERKTGIIRDVTDILDKDASYSKEASYSDIAVVNAINHPKSEKTPKPVFIPQPLSLVNELSFEQWVLLNHIAVNNDFSSDLVIDGAAQPLYQYAPGLRFVSLMFDGQQNLFLLANYSGHALFDDNTPYLTLHQNTILLKISIPFDGYELYQNLSEGFDSGMFVIYPNPSISGIFNLYCNEPQMKIKSVVVKNSSEQLVYADYSRTLPALIDLANQPSGVYVIVIEHEKGVFTSKIVINK